MADTPNEEEKVEEGATEDNPQPAEEGGEPTDAPQAEVTDEQPAEPPAARPAEVEVTKPVSAGGASSLDSASNPLNTAVLKELRSAEEHAAKISALIENLAQTVNDLKQKDNPTQEDISLIEAKQNEFIIKVQELDFLTKKIQELLKLKNVSSSYLGPPFQCLDSAMDPCAAIKELKSPNLPKVIICGNESESKIPKIIVCDPVETNEPKEPVYQQLPGKPAQCAAGPCADRAHEEPRYDRDPSMGQHFAGTMPGPVRQMPSMMGQPPRTMGFPSMTMGPQGSIIGGPQGGMAGGMMGGLQEGMMGPQGGMMRPSGGMTALPGGNMMGHQGSMMGPYGGMAIPGGGMMGPVGMMGVQRMPAQPPGMGMGAVRPPQMRPFPASNDPYRTGPQDAKDHTEGRKEGNDQTFEGMQKKLGALQEEMKKLKAENEEMKKRMISPQGLAKFPEKPICKMTLGKTPICKGEIYSQMGMPIPKPGTQEGQVGKCRQWAGLGGTGPNCEMYRGMGLPSPGFGVGGDAPTKDVETMVASMEEEVRSIQKELDGVQAERRALELQKKVLECVAPLAAKESPKIEMAGAPPPPSGQFPPLKVPPITGGGPNHQGELQYRELVEKYNKLQENFNSKVEEVSLLRVELESSRRESKVFVEKTKDAEARVDDLLLRLKNAEGEEKKIMVMKDKMIDLEQQLVLAKQRYREASEELEGVKTEMNDLRMQSDEYREKYMKAQQTVEEQKNQLDMKNLETARYQEQFMLEFQRIKSHFQSKLEELTPYPEMLKKIQNKLREAMHLKSLAEKNLLTVNKNLETAVEEREKLRKALDEINKNIGATEAEKANLRGNLTDGEKKMEETKTENSKLKAMNARLEEVALKNEKRFEEKVHEVLQLQSQLETLREESARQVSRTKDYCDNVKKTLLAQISELERQVAAAKAAAKLAQQDRDIIRQKMQAQITHLNDNFEQAQMRIRNLQSHVNYLKSSFTNMIAPIDVSLDKIVHDGKT